MSTEHAQSEGAQLTAPAEFAFDLEHELREKEDAIQRQHVALVELQMAQADHVATIARLNAEIAAIRSGDAGEDSTARLMRDLEEKETEIQRQHAALVASQADNAQFAVAFERLNAEIAALRGDPTVDLRREVEEKEAEIQRQHRSLVEIRGIYTAQAQTIERLNAEIAAMRSEPANSASRADLVKDIAEKETEIQKQHRALIGFRAVSAEQTATIARLNEELATIREATADADRAVEQGRELEYLRTQVGELDKTLSDRTVLLDKYLYEIEQYHNECIELRSVRDGLLATCDERLAHIELISSQAEAAMHDAAASDAAHIEVNRELTEAFESERQTLHGHIDHLESICEERLAAVDAARAEGAKQVALLEAACDERLQQIQLITSQAEAAAKTAAASEASLKKQIAVLEAACDERLRHIEQISGQAEAAAKASEASGERIKRLEAACDERLALVNTLSDEIENLKTQLETERNAGLRARVNRLFGGRAPGAGA